MPSVSAILTAAGESTRMGRSKPLLPWHGTTLLEYQIRSLADGGVSEVVVVLGHEKDLLAPYVERANARYAVNSEYRLGKTTSIKAGLRSIDPSAAAVLLLAVDQPRTADIISSVIEAHLRSSALITSPRFDGYGGHPLIFAGALKGELERISEEKQGIREVFRSHRREVNEIEFADPMVRLDVNTPGEYGEAKERYGA